MELSKEKKKYLTLLAEKYPTKEHVSREIINLKAILNLPKGTEHFMSDIHGEYEAFYHILNNCSGVIREKVQMVFKDTLSTKEHYKRSLSITCHKCNKLILNGLYTSVDFVF